LSKSSTIRATRGCLAISFNNWHPVREVSSMIMVVMTKVRMNY
jgi:hypothetical protein